MCAWDKSKPETDSALISAPIRANWDALDLALMATLVAAPAHSLLKVGASDVVEAIAPGAVNTVLIGNGAGVAPSYSTTPTVVQLTVTGAVGGGDDGIGLKIIHPTSWAGLRLQGSGATFPMELWTESTTGISYIYSGGVAPMQFGGSSLPGCVSVGSAPVASVKFEIKSATLDSGVALLRCSHSDGVVFYVSDDSVNPIFLVAGGLFRAVEIGAADSGGSGYRMLRVTN